MRLREPFEGYKLSSGHAMFHIAYLIGSYVACRIIMPKEAVPDTAEGRLGWEVLWHLNLAHLLVPIFGVLESKCADRDYRILEKLFQIISILQYQAAIFYAQFYQMNCKQGRLTGINTWFIIEILSFYGYILAAAVFSLTNSCKSSLGWLDKTKGLKNRYQFDFLYFHRKDLHWAAFVQILFNVNIGLVLIDRCIIHKDASVEELHNNFPLRKITYQLLANHLLQIVFLRDFFDAEGRICQKHSWIWVIHFFSYSYIIYALACTDIVKRDQSLASKMWIPLDIFLTINIYLY
jgi:hypothetical protein